MMALCVTMSLPLSEKSGGRGHSVSKDVLAGHLSQVDLFYLKYNTKLTTHMSPIPEPDAWKIDSLVQSWEGLYA